MGSAGATSGRDSGEKFRGTDRCLGEIGATLSGQNGVLTWAGGGASCTRVIADGLGAAVEHPAPRSGRLGTSRYPRQSPAPPGGTLVRILVGHCFHCVAPCRARLDLVFIAYKRIRT